MGTAFASMVMGALLVFTAFDEQQNVLVEAIHGSVERIKADTESQLAPEGELETQSALDEHFQRLLENSDKLRRHFTQQIEDHPDQKRHLKRLVEQNESVRSQMETLRATVARPDSNSNETVRTAEALLEQMPLLKQQSPKTLLRLRIVEISVPLALSIVSILLTLRYPLTEQRCYEIKEALRRRHEGVAT
jgi:Na+/melibiose symporter-like transporter